MNLCPQCNELPISKLRLLLQVNFKSIKCKKCGAKLKSNNLIKNLHYIGAIIGVTIGGGGCMLVDIYHWNVFAVIALGLLVLLLYAIPSEIIAWKHGKFE